MEPEQKRQILVEYETRPVKPRLRATESEDEEFDHNDGLFDSKVGVFEGDLAAGESKNFLISILLDYEVSR